MKDRSGSASPYCACVCRLSFTISKVREQFKIHFKLYATSGVACPHMPISEKKLMLSLRDSIKASTSAGVL
jgi:hypothetical protein